MKQTLITARKILDKIGATSLREGIEATAEFLSPEGKDFLHQWVERGCPDVDEGDESLSLLSDDMKKEFWETISIPDDEILLYRGDQLDGKTVLEIQRDYSISDLYDRISSSLYEVWTQDRNLAVDIASRNGSGVVFSTLVPKTDVIVAARDIDWLFKPTVLMEDKYLIVGEDRRCDIEEILFLII
jgi:hypothetical protein